jgi:hypothetical protein
MKWFAWRSLNERLSRWLGTNGAVLALAPGERHQNQETMSQMNRPTKIPPEHSDLAVIAFPRTFKEIEPSESETDPVGLDNV